MITILAYHHVQIAPVARRTKTVIGVAALAEHIRVLRGRGDVRSLTEALAAGKGVVITFDDGYRNFSHARRLLQAVNLPATLFVPTDKIGQTTFEPDYARKITYLSAAQLLDISSSTLFTIGAHGRSHRRLTDMPRDEMQREVADCGRVLASLVSQPIEHFCYPYGAVDDDVVAAVQAAGFRSGCTTLSGSNPARPSPYMLRRIAAESTMTADDLIAAIEGARVDA